MLLSSYCILKRLLDSILRDFYNYFCFDSCEGSKIAVNLVNCDHIVADPPALFSLLIMQSGNNAMRSFLRLSNYKNYQESRENKQVRFIQFWGGG